MAWPWPMSISSQFSIKIIVFFSSLNSLKIGFPRIVNFYPKTMNWQNFLNQKLAGQGVGTKLFFKETKSCIQRPCFWCIF